MFWFSSMLSLTTFSSSARSCAISSTTGATIRHGPHHGAQKSTSTGTSDSMTSAWKLLSVTSATVPAIGAPWSRAGYFKKYSGLLRRALDRSHAPRSLRYVARWPTRPTPRSPPRSTSWATCPSSTARDLPDRRLPQRGQGGARGAGVGARRWPAQGRATELPGIGAIIQEKVIALADDGEIPATVKLRAKFPPGLIDDDPAARDSGPSAPAGCTRSWGSTRSRRSRAAAEEQRIRALKGFGPKAEEAILASLRLAGAGERPARVVLDRALAIGGAAGRGAPRAPRRRPTSSWPARPDG